jgi:hypothetical protein
MSVEERTLCADLENEKFAASRSAADLFRRESAKTREQLDGGPTHHPSALDSRKFGGLLKPLDTIHCQVAAEVGKVRSEQDLVQTDDVPQHPQYGVAVREGGVPIESPKRLGDRPTPFGE